MAAVGRLSVKLTKKSLNYNNVTRSFSNFRQQKSYLNISTTCACVISGSLVILAAAKWKSMTTVHALRKIKDETLKAVKLSAREKRFIKFASVEFDGQLYMTPQDFLESVMEQEPRPRIKRRELNLEEVENLKNSTPDLRNGTAQMFRNLRDKGIISYTEYLFLLSILTKPQSGFRIAFNMFDTDGNKRVDKMEFLVMEKIFSYAWKGKRGMEPEQEQEKTEVDLEETPLDHLVDDEVGLQRKHKVDTTLQIHFFGKKGNSELRYDGFSKFMTNLQLEMLELEYQEFAKGHETISEVDFAKILLRYTYLDMDAYDAYLDRLLDRVTTEKGISFDEFKDFCQFLNNLEDFAMAMKMYTLADHPISKDEFFRAVKICTGTSLTPHVVNTVFAIFDEDGDGHLSYQEFIAIMKDRLHRGFKTQAGSEGWEAFKSCVKTEMRSQM